MANLKYYPIGSIIDYNGVKLKVVKQKYNLSLCTGCYFNKKINRNISCSTHRIACTPYGRKDNTHIILVEETNEEN